MTVRVCEGCEWTDLHALYLSCPHCGGIMDEAELGPGLVPIDRAGEVRNQQPPPGSFEEATMQFAVARDEFIRVLEREARSFVKYVLSIGRKAS